MDSLPASDFSSEQREIVECRINGLSYEQIIDHIFQRFEMKIYDDKISTCLFRSSLGYRWEFSMNGGNTPYLCKEDYEALKALINDFFELGSSMDCDSIIDEAEKLKTSRHHEAIKFLEEIKCQKLAHKIDRQQISPPSRPWINGILSEIDAHIISHRLIDFKRLESCFVDVVDLFFSNFAQLISSFSPYLIFGCDETMIEPKPRKHVVVPTSVRIVLEETFPNQKHITGMMSHCVTGQALPPFIILNSLQNLPSELNDLCDFGRIWCGSTSSGYITKDMFLIWCFHFINWLNEYRTKLPIEIRNKPALLI